MPINRVGGPTSWAPPQTTPRAENIKISRCAVGMLSPPSVAIFLFAALCSSAHGSLKQTGVGATKEEIRRSEVEADADRLTAEDVGAYRKVENVSDGLPTCETPPDDPMLLVRVS